MHIVNEFNRRRLRALGFVVAGALCANAFLYVDGTRPVLMVVGLVLGLVVVFGAIHAGLKLHALRCPSCGERFTSFFPTTSPNSWLGPLSNRCANCGRAYADA